MLNKMALARRVMRITELADKMGETKLRIQRHLATLKEMGLVEQEQSSEKYRLGWRLFQLGEAAGAQFDLRYRAEPYLIKLQDELKQTAVLAIPINDQPMVIATAENIYGRICISVKPGNRPLPYFSAFGRLMLAYASLESQQSLLSGTLPSETEDSLINGQSVLDRLPLIRRRLFDYAAGEMMVGINVDVVPDFRDDDVLAGAISIVGSIQDISDPDRSSAKICRRTLDPVKQQCLSKNTPWKINVHPPGQRFRLAMAQEKPLQIVEAINAHHALLAKRSGYRAIYLSGGGVAAGSLGCLIWALTRSMMC